MAVSNMSDGIDNVDNRGTVMRNRDSRQLHAARHGSKQEAKAENAGDGGSESHGVMEFWSYGATE